MNILSNDKPDVGARVSTAIDGLPPALKVRIEQRLAEADTWSPCPRCGDKYQRFEANGECIRCNEWAVKQRAQEGRITAALGGAKAMARMKAETFTVTPENRAVFEAVNTFDYAKDNLYLFGSTGTGKTHAAVIGARRVLADHQSAEVLKTYQILRSVRMKTPDEEQAIIDRLVALPGLVIDDLGVEKSSEYALTILYEIIDRRDMDERNGLIVTSNLSPDQLAAKMQDDRLPSRLAGMCRVIKIEGKDWRASKG